MGTDSGIQWTDHTWNPWHGCTKVSAGCKFCYMYRDKERYGQDPTKVVRASPSTFNKPMSTGKHAWQSGARVFTCSWSDWFIEDADPWRDEAWAIVKARPDLTFQILTKRPERIADHLPADWGHGYPNVWLGVSVEDQAAADKRIPILCRTFAGLRFLSVEPMLGPVDILAADDMALARIDWVILGGESGSKDKARRCDPAWMSAVVAQCRTAGVDVFVKQMGSVVARENGYRDSRGGDPDEWWLGLRVRQFPRAA